MSAPELDTPDLSRAGYSRVTLVGRQARADLVLPSAEPLGALLTEILTVLGEPTAGDPRRRGIATAVGDLLPMDATLASAGIVDGTVLLVVSEDELPPPPVVNDVTEETASDLEARTGRWADTARAATTVVAAAVLSGLAAVEIAARTTSHDATVTLVAATIVCAVVALVLAVVRLRAPAVALDRIGGALVCGWVVLAVAGAAFRSRGAQLGAALGLLLALGWVALRRSPLTDGEADALVLAVTVVVLGLLPQWAVSYSGLTTLDDRRLGGEVVARRQLEVSLLTAHAGLIWATVAASATLAVTGGSLALSAHQFPCWLAAAAALVALLRARTFPLVAEVVAVVTGGLVVAVALELAWSRYDEHAIGPLITTAVAAAVLVLTLVLRPAAHVQARLRGFADRLESLAVVAVVPLVVGVFGVFGRLLGTF